VSPRSRSNLTPSQISQIPIAPPNISDLAPVPRILPVQK